MKIPVIVVTQFERFGEAEELITLDELRVNLAEHFPDSFRYAVFYQAANSEWKSELRRALQDAVNPNLGSKSCGL